MANPYLKPYTQSLRRAKGRTQRKPFQTGIAPGDEPTSKLGNKVVYGAKGLQTGVPKSMQLRNRVTSGGLGGFDDPDGPKPPLPPVPGGVVPPGGVVNDPNGPQAPNLMQVVPPRFRNDPQAFQDWAAKHGKRYVGRVQAQTGEKNLDPNIVFPVPGGAGGAGTGGGAGATASGWTPGQGLDPNQLQRLYDQKPVEGGRNPSAHQAWWTNQGWSLQNGRWVRGGGGGGTTGAGGGGGGAGGGSPGGGTTGGYIPEPELVNGKMVLGPAYDAYIAQFGHAYATEGPNAGTLVDAATGRQNQLSPEAFEALKNHIVQIQAAAAAGNAGAQAALNKWKTEGLRGNLGAAYAEVMGSGSGAIPLVGQPGYVSSWQRLRDAGLPPMSHPFWNAEDRTIWPEFYAAWLKATTVGPGGEWGFAYNPQGTGAGAATTFGGTPGTTAPGTTGLPGAPTNPQTGGQTHVPPGTTPPIFNPGATGAQLGAQPQGLAQLLSSNGLPSGGVNTQGLPLDATFEASRRMAEDQLSRTLSGIGPGRESIAAQQGLAQARLGTQQGIDQQSLIDQMAGRGTLSSSINNTERGNLATAYLRQNQDLSADVADAYSSLAEAASGAFGQYAQQMAEYLLELANRSASDQNAPVDRYQRGPKNKRKKRRQ